MNTPGYVLSECVLVCAVRYCAETFYSNLLQQVEEVALLLRKVGVTHFERV